MLFDYCKEIFEQWTTVYSINFLRKLENETAFDGVIKIFSVKTDNPKLNKLLEGLYFGSFAFKTNNGILLRQFFNRDSWPNTMLVFLNTRDFNIKNIKKTNSSYQDWEVKELKAGQYRINLTPKESIDFIDTD